MHKEQFEIALPIAVPLLGRIGKAMESEFPGAVVRFEGGFLVVEVDMPDDEDETL